MKFFIWANLKMNKNISEFKKYLEILIENYKKSEKIDLVIMPTFTNFYIAFEQLKWKWINLWAQNMYYEELWSYTWEVSPIMLQDFNCKYVILGHSERRKYFWETNDFINKKVISAINHNIRPILCIWENINQKKKWLTKEILKKQLTEWLLNISDYSKIEIAYEPIWAVWTEEAATPKYIKEIHDFIRDFFWKDSKIRIIYWWSVNTENALIISKIKNVNGFLIWKQALEANKLIKIIENVIIK